MITTDDPELAGHMRLFRNHGITRDPKCFSSLTSDLQPPTSDFSWFYEMVDLGYNYRLTDFQCALGISQLQKLPRFLERRREIAKRYDDAFTSMPEIVPLAVRQNVLHGYHLYVVKIDFEILGIDRATLFAGLRKKGIAVNVHYVPVHLHPFYRNNFNTEPGFCPNAEAAYEQIISLPMFPGMTNDDVESVVRAVQKVISKQI